MLQYPLNELKRRLQDDDIPLPKRFKLATNVVKSHHFPTAPKEKVIGEWLLELVEGNALTSKELLYLVGWLNNVDDLTNELKIKLIKVVSQYIHNNTLQINDITNIISFIENNKISTQLHQQIDDYLSIITTLLQNLHSECTENEQKCEIVFKNLIKCYKESKKKLEFIIKFINGENIETVFSYLNTKCHNLVLDVCRNILFPLNKRQLFSSFLLNLIRKDNIDELIAEKGDNIQSVLKIMSVFFTFPTGRTDQDYRFLTNFVNVFVNSYRNESQLIFAFYIMVANSLNMKQNYLNPEMVMPPIIFDDKIKRQIFLDMLEILLDNEVDISVRLTDTLGEKIAKVEIKKTFIAFLQIVMMGLLKLEGKCDKVSLKIIKTAIKLDPSLIEQKIGKILPHIMTVKKNSVLDLYIETINCLMDVLFKLSRGIEFVSQLIPSLKINLEASNVEQFELKQKLMEEDCDKVRGKIITGNDIFPEECVELYGKLTSELMFRQNKELLLLLQADFEANCLMMLEEGFVSPSIIMLAQMLSSLLSSFFKYNKMADHTVPLPIAEDFWATFQNFENQCLNKFGDCVLKLNYDAALVSAFLKLCLSVSHLKLLNIKYSNTKLSIKENDLLPLLNKQKWSEITQHFDDDVKLIWDQLLQTKTIALELSDISLSETKTNPIEQIQNYPQILNTNNYFTQYLFTNLDLHQLKKLSQIIIKNNPIEILESDAILNNKPLLHSLILEVSRNISQSIENADTLTKALNKKHFDIVSFIQEIDLKDFFNSLQLQNDVTDYIKMLKHLQIHYLEEKYQLTAIFVLLITKKCCQSKKLRKSIDYLLQSIFELSLKCPDLYKMFPVKFILNKNNILDLLKLNNKNTNEMFVIKSILELGVRNVKTNPDVVKNIVEILVKNHKKFEITNIGDFSESVFRISCIVFPIIAKERKAITSSELRSILADLQEKLHVAMLDSFKDINFSKLCDGNEDDTLVTLNAMEAFSLLLLKCFETDGEINNLDCLWSGLEFFINNAIKSIQDSNIKTQLIQPSIQLLNITLRYIKKLETNPIFKNKDKLFIAIWNSVKTRLSMVYGEKRNNLEEMAVTLKFVAELSSVDCFNNNMVADLSNLAVLKEPSIILKDTDTVNSELISRKVSKCLWQNCLKANIIGPKCTAITKIIFKTTKYITFWIQQHYSAIQDGVKPHDGQDGDDENNERILNTIKIDDLICNLLKYDLDVICEVVLTAKKISLDYKFLDAIFELQHILHYTLGLNTIDTKCEISWQSFIIIFEACVSMLNNLLVCRQELLEDRWPCFMQCFKPLILCLCQRATLEDIADKAVEHKLAELAHSIEKLTQSICKRKTNVSRISAYAVADICTWLERNPPPKIVRQHLENSISLFIQVSDSTYSMAFLRRALAGSVGQNTLTNMYTMYKRYHKYVGNA